MNQKSISTAKIGAILLFAVAALRIIFVLNNNNSLSGMSWLYYLGTIAIGVGLLMNKYLVGIISSAICALLEVCWIFQEIKYEDIWQGIVYEFSYLIAFVLLIVIMLPNVSNSMSREVHKLWFLPGAVIALGYIPVLLYNIKYSYNYLTDSFKYVFVTLLFIAGVFLIGHGICNPPASSESAGQNIQGSPVQSPASSHLSTTTVSQTVSAAQESFSSDNFVMLRKYKELLDAGVFTQEEFDEKKKELLG